MSRVSVFAVVALGAAAATCPTTVSQAVAQDASADRYGPPSSAYPGALPAPYQGGAPEPRARPQSGPPAMLRGRTLSWPGKQNSGATARYAASAYPPAQSVRAYPPQVYQPTLYTPPSGEQRTYASPSSAPTPYARRFYPGSTVARQPDTKLYAQPAPAPRAYASRYERTYVSPRRTDAQRSYAASDAPSPDGWRPVFVEAPSREDMQARPTGPSTTLAGAPNQGVPNQTDLPTSIYTPAPPAPMSPAQRAAAAPPPMRTASAAQRYGYDPEQGHQVRFYSVHRPFGLQPDSAPIPPQFFTNTADLSQPPGPLPTDRTTSTTTASGTRVSHMAPDTSVN